MLGYIIIAVVSASLGYSLCALMTMSKISNYEYELNEAHRRLGLAKTKANYYASRYMTAASKEVE